MSWEPDISRALRDKAALRQWTRRAKAWMGHPVLDNHKWHFLALGLVLVVAVPWGLRAEEHALEDSTVQALSAAGIAVADVSFNGRDAVISAPASSLTNIEAALGGVTGVRNIKLLATELPAFLTPSTPTPVASATTMTTTRAPATTTTSTTVPPRTSLVITVGNSVKISGTLPDAATIATLTRGAEFLYGSLMTNDLLADGAVPTPVWLESADDVLRLAPWLSQGTITLDGNTATVTGTVANQALVSGLVGELQRTLGADVPLTHDVSAATGPPPSFEIIANVDTVELRGTVPDRRTMERIVTAVSVVRGDAVVSNETVFGVDTPGTYLTLRTPYLIRLLGRANEFTLRYDDTEIRGSVVGGAYFGEPTAEISPAMELLIDALAATMIANPDLVGAVEIHSASAVGTDGNLTLSQERTRTSLLALVRAGVDPDRITVTPGDGAGELLRFTLTTAENK